MERMIILWLMVIMSMVERMMPLFLFVIEVIMKLIFGLFVLLFQLIRDYPKFAGAIALVVLLGWVIFWIFVSI